ncbi:phosphonopyruvate decarboxylase [Streptomyces sp. NPDC014983]|uniref:phosphonopyruvate decarboxylase n=1 Tax=Streptomyces sp. NPDC014983 TaxID=3364933 RepID=UPI0036F97640
MTDTTPALPADLLDRALRGRGVDRFAGVPCSYFAGLIPLLQRDGRYVASANEGAAFATACGFSLAGSPGAVLVQNSGLGNLVNPLTSLAAPYDIGVLMFVSHRGDPDGPPDEPQHRLMGAATVPLLDALRVPHWQLSGDADDLGPTLDAALDAVRSGRTAALVVPRGVMQKPGPAEEAPETSERPGTQDVVAALGALLGDELVVSTTGFTSRWLFAGADRPGNFYMQGSMGHAISLGLGLALARTDRRVFVLDGDGACLMHMGALGTVGAQAPGNLVHVVLDNQQYESTGGQPTAGARTRFEDVARASGYRWGGRVTALSELKPALESLGSQPGPALLVIETTAGAGAAPPRATASLEPEAIRTRFMTAAAG